MVPKVIVQGPAIKNAQNLLGELYLLMITIVTTLKQKKTVGCQSNPLEPEWFDRVDCG